MLRRSTALVLSDFIISVLAGRVAARPSGRIVVISRDIYLSHASTQYHAQDGRETDVAEGKKLGEPFQITEVPWSMNLCGKNQILRTVSRHSTSISAGEVRIQELDDQVVNGRNFNVYLQRAGLSTLCEGHIPGRKDIYSDKGDSHLPVVTKMQASALTNSSKTQNAGHKISKVILVRKLSSKSVSDPESPETEADVLETSKKSIEDFKHEEIIGPTVDVDESDTANEMRNSITGLKDFIQSVSRGLAAIGMIQLLAANLHFYFHNLTLSAILSTLFLASGLPFLIAYLLQQTAKNIEFFSRVEQRSRLRILTLSLQVVKGLSGLFRQSSVIVKVGAVGAVVGIVLDLWRILG